jgi:uracil-DNA glycosylase
MNVDQSWTILKISQEAAPDEWKDVFKEACPELTHISKKLDDQKVFGDYYPLKPDLFNAFHYCPLSIIKVVIVHDQPYNTLTTINHQQYPKDFGMAFSLRPHDVLSPSLKNIYQELCHQDEHYDMPSHGDLRSWCQQGVLLLNKSLTVSPKISHLKWDLWLGFLNKVFKAINKVNPYCIFLLWGQEAQKITSMLPDSFIILEAASPQGYGYHFFGCNHFKMVNDILIKQKKQPIDWQI